MKIIWYVNGENEVPTLEPCLTRMDKNVLMTSTRNYSLTPTVVVFIFFAPENTEPFLKHNKVYLLFLNNVIVLFECLLRLINGRNLRLVLDSYNMI